MTIPSHFLTQKETAVHHHFDKKRQVHLLQRDIYDPVEEPREDLVEGKQEPTPIPTIVEPKPEPEEHQPRNEATPSASVPPDSIASFTYENTPEVDFPPVKRKRGRPAKIRPPAAGRLRGNRRLLKKQDNSMICARPAGV